VHSVKCDTHWATSLFGLSRYLDRTFAQRIGSAKVKSKSEVGHYRCCQSVALNGSQLKISVSCCVLTDTSRLHNYLDSIAFNAKSLE